MVLSMALMVLSRSDYFRYDEVEGKIASVVMDAIGQDDVFVEGYIVRNKDWVGLVKCSE